MDARDNFNDLKNQMEALEVKSKEIEAERNILVELLNDAFRALLIEEKMLGQKTWSLQLSMSGCGELRCDARSSEWKELADFAETNYHCRFTLSNDEWISFDDREISIFLKDMSQLRSLIDTYGMKVRLSGAAEKNIKQMEKSIAEIKKWQEVLDA